MTVSKLKVGANLQIRPSNASDKIFLEQLHNSTRDDLKLIDGEKDFVDSIIEMQYRAQTEGYGSKFPNAMYFVIEKQHERIGKVTIDFGPNEVRLIDIAFIPEARGKGFGPEVIAGLQKAAEQVSTPLTLSVLSHNLAAKSLYLKMGFVVENVTPPYEFMAWYPTLRKIMV
jgi:ribosomal protein S18 acetylase RimI-like enzyme